MKITALRKYVNQSYLSRIAVLGKVYLIPATQNTRLKLPSASQQVLDKPRGRKPRQSNCAV